MLTTVWSMIGALERCAPMIKTALAVVGVCVITVSIAEMLARVVVSVDDSFEGTKDNAS